MRTFRLSFLAALFFAIAANAADPIRIVVDATDASRDVLHARLTIPATAGPLTLYYPKWIPGEHGPTGPLVQTAGFKVAANNQTIAWTRDPREMYAMRVDVPSGAN